MQLISVIALASAATALTVPPQRRAGVETKHLLTAPDNSKFALKESVINSAAYKPFQESNKVMFQGHNAGERRTTTSHRPEFPNPNRNATTPDYVYTLMCTDPGFRGECLVFGAQPGECVSFRDFDSSNSTAVSDAYDNKITSLSTNSGGVCQFYKFLHCNNKGDDRGISLSYDYDLAVELPSEQRTVEYNRNVSSWRC